MGYRRNFHKFLTILYKNGASLNAVDENGYTAVHHLCENSMEAELDIFLSWNPDVNKTTKSKGYSPLHINLMNNNSKITRLLILAGVDVNQKTKAGELPIHMVKHVDSMKLLMLAGAKVDSLAEQRINSQPKQQAWYSAYEQSKCGCVNRLCEIARGVIRQELKHNLSKVDQTGLPNTLQKFVLMKG